MNEEEHEFHKAVGGGEEMCAIFTWVVVTEVRPYANAELCEMERALQAQGTDCAKAWW